MGKLTTVVFVDVESSTELLTGTGDARGTATIERILDEVCERVEPYGGRWVKSLGDGLMLTFDSPRSAVGFAVAVQRARNGHPRLRIGMNFGETTGDDPMGEAVNAAARIAAKAAGGEILVSDVVCRLAGSMPGVRFLDRGRMKLKGFADRWQLFGAVGAADANEATAIFGRDDEVAQIGRLLESVIQGSGRFLLFEGEAGIGKSHLARAAAHRGLQTGLAVATAGADELEQDRPGRILAAAAEALSMPSGLVSVESGQSADPAYAVVERFIDAIEDRAVRQPILLVLDDLHWADELSLRGLTAVVRRLGPLPIGVIATTRPFPRPAGIFRLLALAEAGSGLVGLGGLDAMAIAGLVASVTGAAPGPTLRRRLEATAGNPLYVAELLRALDEDGSLWVDAGVTDTNATAIPDSLVQSLGRRIDSLPHATSEILRLASLLGSEFLLVDLATVAGRSVVEVAALLREAVEAALVAGQGHQITFRHDLIREAVYVGVPPAIRTDLHLAAGQALAAAGAPTAKVARQYALGARRGDLVAVDWLQRAGGEALTLDTSTAVSLFERAAELAPPDWPDRVALESTLVELLAWSGRVEDARALGRAVLDRSLTPADELMARRAFGAVLGTIGELGDGAEQLYAAADLPGVEDDERAVLRCAAAGMAVIAGTRSAEEAKATARPHLSTENPALACWAHNTLAVAAVAEGAYDDMVDHARTAANLVEADYVPALGFLIPHSWVPTGKWNLDDVAGCESAAIAARARGEQRGDAGLVLHSLSLLAAMNWSRGVWSDAASDLDAAVALSEETGLDAQRMLHLSLLALQALGRGDRELVETHVRAGEEFFAAGRAHLFGLDILLWVRALLLESDGEVEAARDLLDMTWEQTAGLRGLVQWRTMGADLARLCWRLGDLSRAETVAAEMQLIANRSSSVTAQAATMRAQGFAADDPDLLISAAAAFLTTDRRVETAAALEEAATMLMAHDRQTEASAMLADAWKLHEAMGATAHAARVDALLRASGVRRRRSTTSTASHGWGSLSPKEHEVVGLVADGLSNPRIAERMFISRRTVESHLGHIFRKLDLDNRTQLATEFVERGSNSSQGDPA